MVFAECRSIVAVLPQYLSHSRDGLRPDPGIAWKSSSCFCDAAGIITMMIVSGKQGYPCRGAQGRRMKTVVSQSVLRKAVVVAQ